jgi:hypothetical protein
MEEVEGARSVAPSASSSAVSSPTAAVATITATVEPAPAVSAVIVAPAVSVRAVVATRGFVSVLLTATTRAKGDTCDHQYGHHYRHN